MNKAFNSSLRPQKRMAPFGEYPALKLDIEQFGLFDTIYFREDEKISKAVPDGWVEVKTAVVGMNFKVRGVFLYTDPPLPPFLFDLGFCLFVCWEGVLDLL